MANLLHYSKFCFQSTVQKHSEGAVVEFQSFVSHIFCLFPSFSITASLLAVQLISMYPLSLACWYKRPWERERDLVNLASPSVVFMSVDKCSGLWHSSNSERLVLHVYIKRHQIKGFSKAVHNHLRKVC